MEVRLVRPEEGPACNAFYNEVYGRSRTLAQWEWEFTPTKLAGAPSPYAVVLDAGKIVATQALLPLEVTGSTGDFWSAKTEEMVIAPSHRGRGLLNETFPLLLDFCRQHEIACLWGCSTAVKPWRRLGVEVRKHTTQLLTPFDADCLSSSLRRQAASGTAAPGGAAPGGAAPGGALRRLGLSAASVLGASYSALRRAGARGRAQRVGLRLATLDAPPPEGGELTRRFVRRWGGITLLRDPAYLEWRLFRNPHVRSVFRAAYLDDQLVGWVAYCLGADGMGYLVDLLAVVEPGASASTDDVLRCLLLDAADGTRRMGALGLRAWSVTQHPFDVAVTRAAKSVGYVHVPRGHPIVYRALEPHEGSEDFDAWYMTRICTEGGNG